MKLRAKLVWVGILVVLISMLLSTGMMWYLIRQQNDKDARQRSGQLVDMIRQELTRQGGERVEGMTYFSQDAALLYNLSNLAQNQNPVSLIPALRESYKKGTAILLEKFARINKYDVILLFDQAYTPISYVKFETDTRTLSFVTTNESEETVVKSVTLEHTVHDIPRDADAWELQESAEIIPIHSPTENSAPAYSIDLFEGDLTLKISVPILDTQETSAAQVIGNIIGYRYIDRTFTTRLAEQIQAKVNFFIDTQLHSGTLTEFTEISSSHLNELQNMDNKGEQSYLYTEQYIADHPFYQAYYPLVRGEDGTILSTLAVSLSREPTYQKTREVTMLQGGVSIVCMLIIIPVTWLLAGRLARPIHEIALVSEAIANGRIDQRIDPIRSKDEIGILSRSFYAMVNYLRSMAKIAEDISHGEITQDLKPKMQYDVLGQSYHRMTTYLKHIAQAADRIHQGDLTQTVTPQSDRDVLGTTFYHMSQRIQTLVSYMRTGARELAEASNKVATASENTSRNSASHAKFVETISSALQETALNINSISQNLETQSMAIDHVKASTQRIAESSGKVAGEIEQVSSFTEQTVASINKMDTSVQEIHHQVQASVEASNHVLQVAQEGTNQVNRLINEIHAIHKQMEIASEAILRLQGESKHIGEILDVIQEVIDQTNLLALNASIIAAQAGTHGKAFGVVAEEVKALATRTSESTKEISEFTKTIQTELSEAVNAMVISANYVEAGLQISEKTEQVLETITTGAEQSSQLISHTAENVEDHTRASRQMQQASTEVVRMLEDIARLTQEQQEHNASIREETDHLTGISQEIHHAIMEQEHAAHQSVGTMANMSEIVQQNAERAERLSKLATNLSSQANSLLELVEEFILEKK